MSKSDDNKYELANEKQAFLDYVADRDAEPIVYADVVRELGIAGTPLVTRELIGETLTILRGKPYKSAFPGQKNNPWFVVFTLPKSDQLYSCTIGGGACTEILEAFANAGYDRPLTVKLGWKEGGAFDGYYIFE